MCWGTSSGTITQLFHFGPIIAISLISYLTAITFHCLIQWWPPTTTGGIINICIYCTWPFLIFYNYFNAMYLGPGFVPLNWKPKNPEDEKKLQYCKVCKGFKAPRSHHCRKCNRCVMKMDHHCPWINTCCGHKNHSSFVYFLLYAPLGCIHATFILGPSIYRAIFRNYYIYYDIQDVPIVHLSFIGLIACMLAIGMTIGVVIAVGILFVMQTRAISRNRTGIEDWIVKKAHFRRREQNIEPFIYPYDLGTWENFHQVFNWRGSMRPIGDGLTWNIAKNCDQYTLTVEQLSQKEEKRNQALKYTVVRDFNGSWFPISYGWKVSCCFPWSEDPRMPIYKDETILVTRWQKHWLYGERIIAEKGEYPVNNGADKMTKIDKNRRISKGWFPFASVRLIPGQIPEQPPLLVEEQTNGVHDKKID